MKRDRKKKKKVLNGDSEVVVRGRRRGVYLIEPE